MEKEVLETDFDEDEKLQVNFLLANEGEKEKLKETAKANGLTMSGLIRYLIIKEWRSTQSQNVEVKHNGNKDI